MNGRLRCKCLAYFFIATALLATISPAVAYSLQQQAPRQPLDYNSRAYNVKSNNIKKTQKIEVKEDKHDPKPSSILKNESNPGGFLWGNLMGMALKLFSGAQAGGTATPIDKVDKTSPTTSSEFSWTKVISLGLQLILSFFGNDNVAIDKMDPGSPIEAFLTAMIAYFTGSNNAEEVSVMAKQATELWGIVISLLDTLRTSFSQRSFEARAIGTNDLVADAAIASTSMVKGFIKSYNTEDDRCMQKYICEFNHECASDTSDSGYLFCQLATYMLSYALDGLGSTYAPFEILNDAGRMGRVGKDCAASFKECSDSNYF